MLLPIAPKKSDFFKYGILNFWHYSRMRASMAYLVPYFFSQKVTTVQSYSTLCTFHLGTSVVSYFKVYKGALSHSVAKLTRFCIPIEENRSHRHHRPKPLSFNATLEAMRHHHSTVTLLTFRSPPPTTVRRRHRPVRFRRRPIEASVTVIIRGRGWAVLHTQRSH